MRRSEVLVAVARPAAFRNRRTPRRRVMSVVIAFAPRPRSAAADAAREPAAPATILFFTGIRYERHDEPVVAPRPVKRRGARQLPRTQSAGHPA